MENISSQNVISNVKIEMWKKRTIKQIAYNIVNYLSLSEMCYFMELSTFVFNLAVSVQSVHPVLLHH